MKGPHPLHPQPEIITLTLHTPLERLLVEQALLMARELQQATTAAEHGRVLERCEDAAVERSRELTRRAIEQAAQQYIDGQGKKLP
jgi:hypothetical protein